MARLIGWLVFKGTFYKYRLQLEPMLKVKIDRLTTNNAIMLKYNNIETHFVDWYTCSQTH